MGECDVWEFLRRKKQYCKRIEVINNNERIRPKKGQLNKRSLLNKYRFIEMLFLNNKYKFAKPLYK